MVIKKVMALLRAAVKPEKAGDVYDVDGLCDAIQEVVKKQKQSKRFKSFCGALADAETRLD
jgi:hypothetical protein